MVKSTALTKKTTEKTYSANRYYWRRKKNLLKNFFMDTIELASTILVPVGGDYVNQFVFQGLDSSQGTRTSVGGILMSDSGSRDIAKLFGLVRVNAVSFIVTPAFHNQNSALNLYRGDVILVYYNSKEYRNLTYAGGIQQGKYCVHLNPFGVTSKYISLRGSTDDYISYSSIEADQNNSNIPGYIMIYSSEAPSSEEYNKAPVWNLTIKLYCTFKK